MEIWIEVKDNPNYEVSSLGNVRNKNTRKILKQETTYRGYKRVRLISGDNGKHRYVHRLVADSFYDGDHEGLDINHIDGNKTNNFIANLEWSTRSENIKHAFKIGLKKPRGKKKHTNSF